MRNEFNKRFFSSSSSSYTVQWNFLFLDRIFPFDAAWCSSVVSLIYLSCVISTPPHSHHSLLYKQIFPSLFTTDFCTLFISSDSVEICSCVMFILFMMRVYFIYSVFWSKAQQTQIVNILWMGKSSFRIKPFCDSIFNLYAYVRVFFSPRLFYLASEGFSKTISFAFWILFFFLLATLFCVLIHLFFIFQFRKINRSRHQTPTHSHNSVIIKIVCFGKKKKKTNDGCDGCF